MTMHRLKKHKWQKKELYEQMAKIWGNMFARMEPHLGDIFNAGYQAAKQESPWVHIDAAIVETWKDGRQVDIIVATIDGGFRNPDYVWWELEQCWAKREVYGSMRKLHEFPDTDPAGFVRVTHAMLPIIPPKDT